MNGEFYIKKIAEELKGIRLELKEANRLKKIELDRSNVKEDVDDGK